MRCPRSSQCCSKCAPPATIVATSSRPGAIQAGLVEIGVEVAAYPLMSLSRSLLSCMM
jgi:hypothetical protein